MGVSEALLQFAAVATHGASLRSTEAERGYARVLERAAALEARPLVAHCRLGLGTLYARMQSIEAAREHLGVAATMYGELGMANWLRRARSELVALTPR